MGKCKGFPSYEEAQEIVKRAGIKGMKEYVLKYKELGLPADPRTHYKKKGWTDWETFLEKSEQFPSYDKAKGLVLKEGILSRRMYDSVYKDLGLPSAPDRTYKDKGWIDWASFLGKEKYPPYDVAKGIVQEKGIKDKEEYKSSYERLGLPKNPNRTYNGKGWIKWDYFLGKYPTFEEAKVILKSSNIKTKRGYESSHKELGLPTDPRTYYKDEGWTSWGDLWRDLGYSTDRRKYNLFKRMILSPEILNDAPLQVIYILVSYFNIELKKSIESLLNTTSYEERLNWVKKQLKTLKEGSPSKTRYSGVVTTVELSSKDSSEDYEEDPDWDPIDDSSEDSFEDSSDELSVMEAIKEEFDDGKKPLSEEDRERINITWENYVHGAINRELIAEYDGQGYSQNQGKPSVSCTLTGLN